MLALTPPMLSDPSGVALNDPMTDKLRSFFKTSAWWIPFKYRSS